MLDAKALRSPDQQVRKIGMNVHVLETGEKVHIVFRGTYTLDINEYGAKA